MNDDAASILCEPAQSNAHGHVTSDILHGNLKGKCRTLIPPAANILCKPAESNAHGHVTRGILSEIYREDAGRFRYHLD